MERRCRAGKAGRGFQNFAPGDPRGQRAAETVARAMAGDGFDRVGGNVDFDIGDDEIKSFAAARQDAGAAREAGATVFGLDAIEDEDIDEADELRREGAPGRGVENDGSTRPARGAGHGKIDGLGDFILQQQDAGLEAGGRGGGINAQVGAGDDGRAIVARVIDDGGAHAGTRRMAGRQIAFGACWQS